MISINQNKRIGLKTNPELLPASIAVRIAEIIMTVGQKNRLDILFSLNLNFLEYQGVRVGKHNLEMV